MSVEVYVMHSLSSRHRHGFTLIELLVVIAIIAILAAILFPVFAQARAAARGAASQSNIKQLSLGLLMYVQDYDEQYPLYNSWGDVNTPILIGGVPWTNWAYQIAPYLKNLQIFGDPLINGTQQFPNWEEPLWSDYGLNYTTLSYYSGALGSTPWIFTGASLASLNSPASTVQLAGRADETEMVGLYWYGNGTELNAGGAEAPDCSDIPSWCWADWAVGTNWTAELKNMSDTDGYYTGAVALRKAVNGNFAMCDGHAKFMQAGGAAIGTTWYHGIAAGQVHITNSTTYMWQVQP